jgi:hypothetical protein
MFLAGSIAKEREISMLDHDETKENMATACKYTVKNNQIEELTVTWNSDCKGEKYKTFLKNSEQK